MKDAAITFRLSKIHYSHAGNGPKLLLCFHGYAESEQSFHFLQKYLPPDYQLIAIDLPYHGKTQWNEGLRCSPADLLAIVNAIRARHRLQQARITLMGFSMGGRMALSILQSIPAEIDKILLLAPDGLKVNLWYWLSTQTLIGNRLFHYTMKKPSWFFFLLNATNRLGILNQSVYKFTRHYIHDEGIRLQLYHRWTSLRHIKPNLPLIKEQIRQYAIEVQLFYGRYDRIIRHERGTKFRRGIERYCHLHLLDTGHQVLQEKNAAAICRFLK